MAKKRIYITDVTNRDGLRGSHISISKLQKTMLNIYLNEIGIYSAELGFPALAHESNYINANIELVKKGVLTPINLTGWCPGEMALLEQTLERTYLRDLCVSLPVSDTAIDTVHEKDGRRQILADVKSVVRAAKEKGIQTLTVSAHDASRADREFMLEVAGTAKEQGADRFRYCDSVGCESPSSLRESIHEIAEETGLPLEIHCHNDLGLATANSIMGAKGAIEGGVDAYINATVNGYGERAGNCDLISVILSIKYAHRFRDEGLLDERLDTRAVWKVSHYASSVFGLPIPVNKVGIGSHLFEREKRLFSGEGETSAAGFGIYTQEELGMGEPEVNKKGVILAAGEYSEDQSFEPMFQSLGYEFGGIDDKRGIFELCRYATIHNHKALTADELLFIARNPEQARKIMTVIP